MNVLIAEDEQLAAERIQQLLQKCEPQASVVDKLDSVEDVVSFFQSGKSADLMLLDIQLADGKSFEIFEKVKPEVPIIFTTAYNQFALDAFKLHSIDYLLKPVQENDLRQALDKYKKMTAPRLYPGEEISILKNLLTHTRLYKERLLIKSGNRLQFKPVADVAYFFADGKVAYMITRKENRRFMIDHTLEELENQLDPRKFFRISRKFILSIDSILEVKGLISTKLEVKLNQPCEHDLTVSRDRAQDFKNWLGQ